MILLNTDNKFELFTIHNSIHMLLSVIIPVHGRSDLLIKCLKSLDKKINFDYRDPESINIDEWRDREDEGILYVPNAGEILYLLKDNPFR